MPGGDDFAGFAGRFYSAYIAHPLLARALGRLMWASDFGPLYNSLGALRRAEADVVIDLACGAGLALGYLDPARVGRYVGIDNSPAMLARATSIAGRRGFVAVDLELADVSGVPLPDATADMCLLYNALHCFPRPEAAVAEAARCLRPSGRVVGSMLVRGESRRVDRLMDRGASEKGGMMGSGGTVSDLKRWLKDAGLASVETSVTGSLAMFSARRPGENDGATP